MSNQQIGEVQQVPQAQSQPAVIMSPFPAPDDMSRKMAKQRKVLFGLGISVIILGSICFILGAVVAGIVTNYNNARPRRITRSSFYDYYPFLHHFSSRPRSISYTTAGEGMWGGVWIIIAGILGVASGRRRSSKCLIKTHMAFSIIGAVIAGVMTLMGILFAEVTNIRLGNLIITGLQLTSGILSFILMVLEIFSASYCCTIISCCGGSKRNRQPQQGYVPQVTYAQQPVMVQGMPANVNPGQAYYPNVNPGQAYYPNTTIYQQTLPVAVAQPSQGPGNLYQQPQPLQSSEEGKDLKNASGVKDGPPRYEKFE